MDKAAWNQVVAQLPAPQLLQTWEWGQVKAKFGWTPYYKLWRGEDDSITAAALVLERTIDLPGMAPRLRMHYTPKGPLLADWADGALRKQVLGDLCRFAKSRGAFFIKIDPDVPVALGEPMEEGSQEQPEGQALRKELMGTGWHFANEQVQFRNTVLLDLRLSEDEILANMKQKTRYNIRLAGRKGVQVRAGGQEDFGMLFQMYAETALRDGFTIRGEDYYQSVWQTFFEAGMLTPLITEVEGQAVAGLMLFTFGGRAWYIHGMSRAAHRNLMPAYLLQWEAIRAAKSKGCWEYDLWGAPDEFSETHPMWGVYRFKRGLGGTVAQYLGAWDYPLRPWLYRLYTNILPAVMGVMRRRGNARTRQAFPAD